MSGEEESKWGGVVGVIIGWIIIIGIVISLYISTSNDIEKTEWNFDGSLTLIEAKYFWGGSWFEKDHLTISNAGFSIEKYSLWNQKVPDKKINVPFSKTKKIVLIEGNSIYEIDIIYDGNLWNSKEEFYTKYPESFISVKDYIKTVAETQIIIDEKKSLLKKLSK